MEAVVHFITQVASVFIALILGGALVPVINLLKERVGLSGRAALGLTYVVGTIGALALIWLIGVGSIGIDDVTAEYLLSFAGLIFIGNQTEYQRQKQQKLINPREQADQEELSEQAEQL